MSVAITAQAPVAASSPATASPQASQGIGATTEQGVADFDKARVDAGNGERQITAATNSAASSGEMIGKLREFIEKSHKTDMANLEGPGLMSQGRLPAMAAKMTDDLADAAIHRMWTQVVAHGSMSITKSVMTLLKGQ